jgi:predicted XRE-type DNA-binding protein
LLLPTDLERASSPAAAERLGIRQPDVSGMLSGNFRQFSIERLMRFLVTLGAGHRDSGGPV